MDREGQHVPALVEDLLRPIAVVIIDVEDGDALGPGIAEGLRGDGGIVQETIAAIEIAAGMVSRRPAQSEGRAPPSPPAVARSAPPGPRHRPRARCPR